MADTGFLFPGTAVGNRAITGADNTWISFDNIKADDTSVSNFNTGGGPPKQSFGCAASNFDFSSIPSGDVIDGIEVQLGDYDTDTDNTIEVIRLILADDSDGSENKNTELLAPSTSLQTDEAGGASDLWGESISRADTQDVDFGFFTGWEGTTGSDVGRIDFMRMKVFHSVPTPTITDVNTTESWTDGDTGLVITGTNFV